MIEEAMRAAGTGEGRVKRYSPAVEQHILYRTSLFSRGK
jgi:hypothetical protein